MLEDDESNGQNEKKQSPVRAMVRGSAEVCTSLGWPGWTSFLIKKVNFIKDLKEVRESAKRLSGEEHSHRQSAEQAL